MNHEVLPPSPPAVARAQRHPAAVSLLAASIGLVAGLVFGFGIGRLVVATSECTPTDGWCDLGAALGALLFGGLAGVVAYVVAGVITIHRLRPPDERAIPIAIHVAIPPGLVVLGIVLGGLSEALG